MSGDGKAAPRKPLSTFFALHTCGDPGVDASNNQLELSPDGSPALTLTHVWIWDPMVSGEPLYQAELDQSILMKESDYVHPNPISNIVHFSRGAATAITAPIALAASIALLLVDVLLVAAGYAACAIIETYISLRWTRTRSDRNQAMKGAPA